MIFSIAKKKSELISAINDLGQKFLYIEKNKIEKDLTPILEKLKDDIICYIEYPYVEKIYRDTYYTYFSKKHMPYNRNSIRISFFCEKINLSEYYNYEDNKEIENHFFGFITLRPTTYRIIGHTFISPRALKDNNFVCCLSKKTVLVKGRKLTIYGFPFCSQDNESITCSETTIINLFDYFSSKYNEYSSILPSSITKILSKNSYSRQLPSDGLTTESISYVLKKLGFGTVVYSSDPIDSESNIYPFDMFMQLMYIYIESGIPIIASLSNEKYKHAILVIGRENITENFNGKLPQTENVSINFTSFFKEILVMNDNNTPYEMVDYKDPVIKKGKSLGYQLKSFIVPLYPKVHLEAYQFKKYIHVIIKELESIKRKKDKKPIRFNTKEKNIERCFLTSSKSYKDYIANSKGLDSEDKTILLTLSMPKFIWVGEIIEGDKIMPIQKIRNVVVVDATESGFNGHLMFAISSEHIVTNSIYNENNDKRKQISIIDPKNIALNAYSNNLKGEHTQWKI